MMKSSSLGLESGIVRVVQYDSAWLDLYVAESRRLRSILELRGVSLVLEHTGSTSVVGLAAKPILDILAGRPEDGPRGEAIKALESAGYVYRGEQGIPGRDFFRRGEPRQYHLHLTTIGSTFWDDHLTFRDYLRAHADVAEAYARLKYELAAQFRDDREAYIDGKTSFVQSVLKQARESSG
jgi:GrpB-like predicted nucleotidyltransferase (UPF0157 family)